QEFETISYRAATAFYLYNVLNRDPQEFRKMQAQLLRGDALAGTIENGAFKTSWSALKKSCTSARFTNEGVADNDSVIAVDGALNELTRHIRNRMNDKKAAGKLGSDKMTDMLYDQYILMEVMTAAYLRRSADYFGGAIVASQGPQVEIDKLAEKFSGQMKQLNAHYAKNPKVAPLLRDVTTKWGFVRKSFINFNEDNVAFVVGRYNAQITEKLLAAHASAL
ncbi:MAG: hypothetical protein Q8J78_12760, partial [Moraxellaceae bacterium]|nr:hypothetical protein [Moraxellaceae bacterium]